MLKMDDGTRVAFQWSTIEHLSTWIQAADGKASTIFAISTILFGFVLANENALIGTVLENIGNSLPLSNLDYLLPVILVVGTLLLLFSIFCTLSCLNARTKNSRTIERPSTSLIFFGRIAEQKQADYVKLIESATTDILGADLANQAHVLAQIATVKYAWLRRAYTGLIISFTAFSAYIVLQWF